MKIIAVKVFQLKQLKRRNLKEFRLERGIEPCMTSAIPVQRSKAL